jgi:hypothetical protein
MKHGIILVLAVFAIIAGCIGNIRQAGPDSVNDGFLPGNDAWVHSFPNYGRTVKIVEHKNVGPVPFASLLTFLKEDAVNNTRECNVTGNNCVDFAARLHNNAEFRGINCSIVTFWYRDNEGKDCDHAINAFVTTDRGTVYVDSNSMEERFVFLDPSRREYGYDRLDAVATAADYDDCRCTGNYTVEGKMIGGPAFIQETSAEKAREQMKEQSNRTALQRGWQRASRFYYHRESLDIPCDSCLRKQSI